MTGLLEDVRVLIVEDEFLLADDLTRALRQEGAKPVGPVSKVDEAQRLLVSTRVDAAILDLNLHGDMASGFVERLAATGLPCLIVSGYAGDAMPASINKVPRLEKPVNPTTAVRALAAELTPGA